MHEENIDTAVHQRLSEMVRRGLLENRTTAELKTIATTQVPTLRPVDQSRGASAALL